jgi:argininosuccinate lyase
MRLWLREEIGALQGLLRAFVQVAVDRAAAEADVLMPGYTHLQVCGVRTQAP